MFLLLFYDLAHERVGQCFCDAHIGKLPAQALVGGDMDYLIAACSAREHLGVGLALALNENADDLALKRQVAGERIFRLRFYEPCKTRTLYLSSGT